MQGAKKEKVFSSFFFFSFFFSRADAWAWLIKASGLFVRAGFGEVCRASFAPVDAQVERERERVCVCACV